MCSDASEVIPFQGNNHFHLSFLLHLSEGGQGSVAFSTGLGGFHR
jgi:hypothetical protein